MSRLQKLHSSLKRGSFPAKQDRAAQTSISLSLTYIYLIGFTIYKEYGKDGLTGGLWWKGFKCPKLD